jgi:NADH-quinone oxidoreductase subunit M
MFSDMVEHYNQILAIISAMAVGYGALSAVTQTNSKKLIANLAISQMGITMLGISSMTTTGIQGALFQMFSSSISTSAMFFLLSALYRRANISNLIDFGKIALCMPIFTSLSLLAVICNIGIPFTNCFTGERMILSGILASSLSWRQFIVYIAITGIAINIICTLLLAKKIFWKSIISDQNTTWNHRLTDLTFKEIITIIPILVLSFWINSRPQTFLKQSELQINSLLTNSQIEPTIKSFSTALFTKLRH